MTATRGKVFTGNGGRIVGPERDAQALRDAINDPELHVAFVDGPDNQAATVITRTMMARIGVDYPVLIMPASARARWLADTRMPAHLRNEYVGVLPTIGAFDRLPAFEIVKPGDHRA